MDVEVYGRQGGERVSFPFLQACPAQLGQDGWTADAGRRWRKVQVRISGDVLTFARRKLAA